MSELPDPRVPADAGPADPASAVLHELADASLGATTRQQADALDAELARRIAALLDARDGRALVRLLDSAPSVAVARHLWLGLAREAGAARPIGGIGVTLFAIPVVIVAAATNGTALVPGVLADPGAIVAALREHRALAGNEAFTLAGTLVATETIDLDRLPELLAACVSPRSPLALEPAPLSVGGEQRAYLRFIVGKALSAPGAALLADRTVGGWGRPVASLLIRQLAAPGVALVAIPRAASSLPAAVALGKAAQRDIAAQLFASNALRELRASVGEPVAVISAHRAADAPGGGELRMSLSSPLSPRDAHGFRCPLYAGERASDVAAMLIELLRACRVTDVRPLPGVHADRDPLTGGPLLFKPSA